MSGDRWRLGAGAAIVLVLGAVAGGAIVTMVGDTGGASSDVVIEHEADSARAEVVVDVQGEVRRPGVVLLSPGSRVLDAVAASGGFTENAQASAVNLAREVVDGEQLVVPDRQSEGTAPTGGAHDGRVSINRAIAKELQQLPRVGPALSAAIISHRDQHGPFTDIEQLDDVSGIGPAVLDQLRDLVTL